MLGKRFLRAQSGSALFDYLKLQVSKAKMPAPSQTNGNAKEKFLLCDMTGMICIRRMHSTATCNTAQSRDLSQF
ncbi:hypothetical protein GLUCORHAEAF1_04515 [Komagataeibacter rhaeticus AF1]|nr:hypothetical protein GLUCORHAEAF1_04515 [Komagataeibacter rhaeticus AF1]